MIYAAQQQIQGCNGTLSTTIGTRLANVDTTVLRKVRTVQLLDAGEVRALRVFDMEQRTTGSWINALEVQIRVGKMILEVILVRGVQLGVLSQDRKSVV